MKCKKVFATLCSSFMLLAGLCINQNARAVRLEVDENNFVTKAFPESAGEKNFFQKVGVIEDTAGNLEPMKVVLCGSPTEGGIYVELRHEKTDKFFPLLQVMEALRRCGMNVSMPGGALLKNGLVIN